MCKFGKSLGYNACPLCGVTIILMGVIEGMGLNKVMSISVDNNETICKLGLEMERK